MEVRPAAGRLVTALRRPAPRGGSVVALRRRPGAGSRHASGRGEE